MRTRILLLLLSLTLTLGACGSGDDTRINSAAQKESKKSAGLLEPEMLISRDEAAILLGEPVENGKKSETKAVGMKLCLYNPQNTSSQRFLQVSLTQDTFMPPEGAGSETIYRELKKMLSGSKTDLPELGNEAFIATGGLYLFKNGCYIMIAAGNTGNEETMGILKAAGRKVLENLERLR